MTQAKYGLVRTARFVIVYNLVPSENRSALWLTKLQESTFRSLDNE